MLSSSERGQKKQSNRTAHGAPTSSAVLYSRLTRAAACRFFHMPCSFLGASFAAGVSSALAALEPSIFGAPFDSCQHRTDVKH